MRKLAVAIALIVVIGGAAYYCLSAGTQNDVKQQLDQALQKLPPGWTGGYKSIDVGLASRGAALKGFELHGIGDSKFDLAIDEVDVNDLSFDFIAFLTGLPKSAAVDPATLAPDKALPVAASIGVKGVTLHMDAQDIQIGSGQIDKPRVYLWALLHPGVPSYTEVLKEIQHYSAAPQDNPDQILPVLRFEAAWILGLGEDSYAFNDMTGRVKIATPDAPATDATYLIKKIAGSGVDRGKMASAVMDGMAIKMGPSGDMTVDHVAMTSIDARDTLTRVLAATTLDPAMADGLTLGKLEYLGMTVRPPQQPPVVLSSITVSDLAFAHGLLVSADFGVTGLKINKAQLNDEQAEEAFDKLGLQTATISFGAGYKWDVDKKTAVLKQASLKVDELGTLTLSIDMTGIEKADTLMTTATLNHALLRYDDASFTGRAFKLAAAENGGGDPAAFSKQAIAMVQVETAMLGNSPAIKAAGAAVTSFLTNPHNLTIELAPPQPMAVDALYAVKDLPPPQIFDQLGVKVTANQAAAGN
jgi:hypothetical protein